MTLISGRNIDKEEGIYMDTDKLLKLLIEDTNGIDRSHRAAIVAKVANKYYKEAPPTDESLLEFCEQLIACDNMCLFSTATLWIKKRKSVIDIKHFPIIESWLYKYIHNWGRGDQFCYRVLNPFIEKYPELYSNVLVWLKAEETYVRRAAPVSLICSGGSAGFNVNYDLDKILVVIESLVDDSQIHIQKAIGWLLKYSYLSYPEDIIDYLQRNSKRLSRTAYRYALEKFPSDIRDQMMAL